MAKKREMDRLSGDGLTKTSFNLPTQMKKDLDEQAVKEKRQISAVLRDAVKDYLWRNR